MGWLPDRGPPAARAGRRRAHPVAPPPNPVSAGPPRAGETSLDLVRAGPTADREHLGVPAERLLAHQVVPRPSPASMAPLPARGQRREPSRSEAGCPLLFGNLVQVLA